MIQCKRCNQDKPETDFHKRRSRKTGYYSYCKVCVREYNREHPWNSEAEKLARGSKKYVNRVRNRHRLVRYGITSEQFEAALSQQGHVCAICKTPTPSKRGWIVDHDHSTGVFRGILCNHCNVGLGMAKDSPEILSSMILYLQLHQQQGATTRA